jgi:UPF0755 protein
MRERNRPGDIDPPDMPAVAPLDMPLDEEPLQQQASRRRVSPKSPRQVLQPEAAPPQPPRSQKARHPLVVVTNFFVMAAVLIVLGAGGAFYFGRKEFNEPGPLAETTSVLVQRGSDLDSISALLRRHNVIDSPFIFTTAVRMFGSEADLKAGEYLFQPAVSMRDVLDDLVTGRSVLHTVTFPEGLTSQQIVNRLKADPVLAGEVAEVPPEGSLMPDTYKFTRGATRQQMIDQMMRVQERLVAEIWERRAPGLPVETPEQLVTLASIVEKETGRADERPRVAAVFLNRLERGMRLQSDPTIIYGVYGGAGAPTDHTILRSELDKETPYNTYQITGLPPGPIANPGRAALEAVANPSRTDELYFVADGTGGHAFATSLEEHERNVRRWRQVEAERRAAAAEAEQAGEATEGESDGAAEAVTEEPDEGTPEEATEDAGGNQ